MERSGLNLARSIYLRGTETCSLKNSTIHLHLSGTNLYYQIVRLGARYSFLTKIVYEAEERMKEINEAYHAVISRYPVPARTNRQRQGSAAGHFRYGTQGIGAGFSGPYMGVQTQIRKKAKAEARRNFCIMSFLMVGGFAFFALSSMLVWWLLPYAMLFVYG